MQIPQACADASYSDMRRCTVAPLPVGAYVAKFVEFHVNPSDPLPSVTTILPFAATESTPARSRSWGALKIIYYADPGVDIVRIPGAVEGDYRMVVSGAADSTIVLGASALDGSGFGGADAELYLVPSSGGAGFVAHVVGGGSPDVQIDTLGTTDVQPVLRRFGTTLRVSPNPSHGQVLLGIELPTAGRVVVEVYDLSGRLVARPIATSFEPGHHEVPWNASGLGLSGAGILFLRMKAPDATLTRSIVFLP